MSEDYRQLWGKVTCTTDKAESVQTLAKILADEGGRGFISHLTQEDGELCVEILDHGLSRCNLSRSEKQAFFAASWTLAETYRRLPDSIIIKEKLEVSNEIHASGPSSDIRTSTYNGTRVAVKTLRVSCRDDLNKIRKTFFRHVILWNSLAHPNVLELVGAQWDMNEAQFTTVSKWMACGNIMQYIKNNSVNRLELLYGAAQGLKYLHDAGIAHGDLKGTNVFITNDSPQRACLAESRFMSSQFLAPSNSDREDSVATPESDIYSFGMVIFQVLTGKVPFRDVQVTQLGYLVLNGMRPRKPENASAIGFSDSLWDFVHLRWDGDSQRRPMVAEVVARLGEASTSWHTFMPGTATLEPGEGSESESMNYCEPRSCPLSP
ncbi:kinase-like protein [Thelephora ganbajun]|uniref:Kinase-like protein n=1 Tax=Thelephora ganbajun TaxID=370292 RepID=A0ACB6ZEN5_THEGA|nr:kinase-like protein [Thelephora ganbajun]